MTQLGEGMFDQAEQLKQRAKQFAIRVVTLFRCLPKSEEARIIGRQLLRSGTSVAANYRACCRSRSKSEFVAKIGVVVEETDEAVFWLELLSETGIIPAQRLADLLKEANELLAIFGASQYTASVALNRTRTAGKRNAAPSSSQ
jgi:four helix bundle protein